MSNEMDIPQANAMTESAPAPAEQVPVIARPSNRRRPRFVERPKAEDDVTIVARRNLLTSTRSSDGKPQFSRERKIAGNLPDWDPLPPGELRVVRS